MRKCPACAGPAYVINVRNSKDAVRRRYKCGDCQHRWTTYESVLNLEAFLHTANDFKKTTAALSKRLKHMEAEFASVVDRVTAVSPALWSNK